MGLQFAERSKVEISQKKKLLSTYEKLYFIQVTDKRQQNENSS